jgi:hypothetical protein
MVLPIASYRFLWGGIAIFLALWHLIRDSAQLTMSERKAAAELGVLFALWLFFIVLRPEIF